MSAAQSIFGTETVDSLAKRIKDKYPDYASVENGELVQRVLAKHPDYVNTLSAEGRKDLFSRPTQFEKDRTPEGSALWRGTKAAVKTAGNLVAGVAEQVTGGPTGMVNAIGPQAAQASLAEAQRQQDKRSLGYRVAAQVGSAAGVDASGMEEAANRGDTASIIGQAAVPALLATTGLKEVRDTLGKGARVAGEVTKSATEATAQMARETIPSRLMNSILRTPKKGYRFGKNPGLALAQEGIVANSEAGLMEAIKAKQTEVGTARDAVLANAKNAKPIDIHKTITDALAPEIKQARTVGNSNAVKALETLRDDLIAEHKQYMNPVEATELKSALGRSTNWTTDSTQAALNDGRRRIYSRLRFKIEMEVPKAAKLNERWGNLLEAEKSLEGAIAVGERKNFLGMGDIVAGTAGAVIGGHFGGPGEAGMASTAALAARRAMGSVPVKTYAASKLARRVK
jgi:hypothetical protein